MSTTAHQARLFHVFNNINKRLFNEEGWRRAVTNPHVRWAETNQSHANAYVDGDSGTLYHDYGDGTAHYMAFRIRGRQVYLMDPSGSTGPYRATPQERRMIVRQFPGYRIVDVFDRQGPQHNDYDTLCQTWSLAYLMNTEYMDTILEEASSHSGAETAEDEIREVFDEIDRRLRSNIRPEAVRWRRAYREARALLGEFFADSIPHRLASRRLYV